MTFTVLTGSEDRAAWLEARQKGVTATDVSRLAHGGAAEWQKIKAEKQGVQSFTGNEYTRWGEAREEVIAEQVGDLGLLHNTNLLQQDADPRWLATPDLLSPDGSEVGDIKTAVWRGEQWDEPPAHYRDQLLWQMFVTGARRAKLIVEYHTDFRVTQFHPDVLHVAYDEERVDYLRGLAEQFLAMGEPSEFDLLLLEAVEAKQKIKAAQDEWAAVEKRILSEIGTAKPFKHVSDEVGSFSFTPPTQRESFDAKKLQESDPDTYEKYVIPGRVPKPTVRVNIPKEK